MGSVAALAGRCFTLLLRPFIVAAPTRRKINQQRSGRQHGSGGGAGGALTAAGGQRTERAASALGRTGHPGVTVPSNGAPTRDAAPPSCRKKTSVDARPVIYPGLRKN